MPEQFPLMVPGATPDGDLIEVHAPYEKMSRTANVGTVLVCREPAETNGSTVRCLLYLCIIELFVRWRGVLSRRLRT